MVDIRKRTGAQGTTYQVRYPSKAVKSGYAFKSFPTLKEAREYVSHGLPRHNSSGHATIRTVDQAVGRWLDVCKVEGRQGRDPVSPATADHYDYRASIMRAYSWEKALHELEAPDIVAFRSWLLKNYTRDQAKKVLSSFHSALLEMVTQGVLATDPAARITIQESRYKEPVQIPSFESIPRAAARHAAYSWCEAIAVLGGQHGAHQRETGNGTCHYVRLFRPVQTSHRSSGASGMGKVQTLVSRRHVTSKTTESMD